MIKNGWTSAMEEIRERIGELIDENKELREENAELRAERDYLRWTIDQTGGRG